MTGEEFLIDVVLPRLNIYPNTHATLHVDKTRPDGYCALSLHLSGQTFLLNIKEVPEGALMSELLEGTA